MSIDDWQELEKEVIEKVRASLADDTKWTEEEKVVLRDMIRAWQGFASFGRFAKWVVIVLGTVAAGIAAVRAIGEAVKRVAQ